MSMLIGLIFATQVAGEMPNCGATLHHTAIKLTETLIKKAAPIPNFNSELLNLNQKAICVRVQFSISSSGHAKNIQIVEGYYSRAFDMVVVNAIKNFTFLVPKDHIKNKFMLVFHRDSSGQVYFERQYHGDGKGALLDKEAWGQYP
ncbi:MAG: hypothetical protein ACRESX_03570 [Gammaproteobacteria bacterium]